MCNKLNAVMKKQFFHIVAALALICGVFAFSGCTDFEKDINDLNERLEALETGKIADLENQVKTLQEALNSAQGAIDAIEALGIDGLKDQLDALQGVIDGINLDDYATKDYVDGTFATKDAVKKLEEALGALEGRVEALEGMLSEENIKAILDQIKGAQEDATEALGLIKSLQEALGVYAEAGKLQAALDSKLDIEDFDAKFEEALKAALANDGEVTGEIAKAITDAVNEFTALFANRLTSISLIPSAYLEGVPAIKFNSYEYAAKTINPSTETVTAASVKTRIASAVTGVKYHISPSFITKEDIETPSYVINEAELMTKAGIEDIKLNVVDYSIEKDILNVDVRRTAGISLNHPDQEYIYTAALKVPIAEKNLVEGEKEANVYSEYSALYEDVVTPYIAAVIDKANNQNKYNCPVEPNHFYGKYEDAAIETSTIACTSEYNESIDLLAMVTGCEGNPDDPNAVHKEILKSTLKANGLAFRFAVPTKPFELGTNNTDQQKFARVDGNYLFSTYVNAPEGAQPNEASIDKTPVVRVELVDTVNSKIVDVRYFKVQWVQDIVVPVEQPLGLIYTFKDTLSCVDFNGQINWDVFVEKILAKVNNGNGLSYNEFVKIYKDGEITIKPDYQLASGHLETDAYSIVWEEGPEYDEYAAAFKWEILIDEYGKLIDGKNAADLKQGDVLKTYTLNVEMKSKDGYNAPITFSIAVDVVVPELPSIHGFVEYNWDIFGELARIYPVQYGSTFQTEPTAFYAYDLKTLFNENEDGLFVNGISTDDPKLAAEWACRRWDLQYSLGQQTTYKPLFAATPNTYYAGDASTSGYVLQNVTETASQLLPVTDPAVANWYIDPVDVFTLTLEHNKSGIGLLNYNRVKEEAAADYAAGKLKTVTLDVWGRINKHNAVKVHDFDVWFVNPLTIKAHMEDTFVDLVIGGSKVDASKAFEENVTDYAGYEVAVYPSTEEIPEALRNYYAIEVPTWDVDKALISLEKSGNNLVINNNLDINSEADRAKMQVLNNMSAAKSLTLEGTSTLVFKNEFGWAVTGEVNIYVPATIKHKWGEETVWVKIVLEPAKVTGNVVE